jgi:RHS repeat-associated protein
MQRRRLTLSRPNGLRSLRGAGLTALTCIAVVIGGLAVVPGQAAAANSAAGSGPSVFMPVQPPQSTIDASRGASPEAVALAQAAATGKRVEVTAEDTANTTTYADPDGTLTKAITATPVRVADAKGGWSPVDLSLHAGGDGRLVPAASPTSESFSATGTGDLATLQPTQATSIGLGFDAGLTAPTVKGTTATYDLAGAVGGSTATGTAVSVSVGATELGYAAHVQLASAPASAPTYTFPLHLTGLTASLNSDNQLEFTNAAGDVVADSQPLMMWDAQRDAGGDPSNQAPVKAALVPTPDGGTALQLTPSMDFLTAANTQYPVTIDPDIDGVARVGDTYTDSGNPNSTAGGSDTRIRVGSYYSGLKDPMRFYYGFENFNIASLIGKDVLSATLTVHQYYADSCTPRITDVYAAKVSGPTWQSYSWNDQPTAHTASIWSSSVSGAHGAGSSCPEADVPIDVTRQLNGYTSGELDSYWESDSGLNDPYVATIEFQPDNTTSANEMRFCSDNTAATGSCADVDNKPTLDLTYRPLLGMDTATSTFDHRLNDAASLHINNDTGNAMVKSQDLHITGIGQDLTLTRWYNSAANQTGGVGTTSLGTAGWSLGVGPDVYIEQAPNGMSTYPNRYDVHMPGGAVYGHYVRQSTDPGDPTDYDQFHEPSYGGGDATLKDIGNDAHGHDQFTLTEHASQTVYTFTDLDPADHNLYLTSVADRSGNTITYTYTAGGHQLASIVDTDGRTLSVAYNTSGYLHTITDNFGPVTRTWTYDYDSSGHGTLVDYIDPTGAETDYDYTLINGDYLLTKITDPAQSTGDRPATLLSYDSQTGAFDELQYQTGVDGSGDPQYATFTWDYPDTQPAACDKGNHWTVVSDLSDDPTNHTTYCFQDLVDGKDSADSQTAQVIDGEGNRRTSEYSPDRKPSSLTSPEDDNVTDGSTTVEYGQGSGTGTAADQLDTVTEPNDPGHNAAKATYRYEADPSIHGYQYLPTSVTDTDGNCTRYDYNATGLVNATTIGLSGTGADCSSATGSHKWQATYNGHGQITATWDANGTNTAGDDTRYSYNTDGQLVAVQKPGNTTGPPCTAAAPQALCTSYTYDGDGRTATMTDGRGNTTTYTYDQDDRVVQVLFAGAGSCVLSSGNCIAYTYDGEGNLVTRTDLSGTTSFGYDWLNQQATESLPDGSSIDTTYDAAGNLMTYTQTVHTTGGDVTDTEIYTHNKANQTITATESTDNTDHIVITPNKDGNTHVVTYPTIGGIQTVTTDYTNSGHVKTITPDGTSDGTALPTYAYTWDQSGQETDQLQSVDTSNGQSSQDGTISYTYDPSEELTGASDNSSQPDYSYSYDNAGNLQSATKGSNTTNYGYTEAGILCWQGPNTGTSIGQTCPSTPTGDTRVYHDDDGNNVGTYTVLNTYDAADRASSLDDVTQTYLDQGNDLRSAATNATTTYGYINGPLGVTARVQDGHVTFYIRNTDGTLLEERGFSGKRYYVLGLHQSVTGLVDATGSAYGSYLYGPYGTTTVTNENGGGTATSNPFRWDGGYHDTKEGDNLYHYGARYYDPTTARWTQPDPKTGSIDSPLSLESYSFGQDDPIDGSDTSGRFDLTQVLIGGEEILDGLGLAGSGALTIAFTWPTIIGAIAGGIVVLGGVGLGALGLREVYEGVFE